MLSRTMFLESPTEKLKLIADSVLKLSNHYIENPEANTPWNQKFCQIAYRHYYLPLNYIRCKKVIERGLEVDFFQGLTHFIDWGAGPGTASLALVNASELKPNIKKQILFDLEKSTLNTFSDLHTNLVGQEYVSDLNLQNLNHKKNSCLVFSYSLTEQNELPHGWQDFEALMILEPSTSQDGRKLLELRAKLISQNFNIWAPCVHQLSCPLLSFSKNDWCHDRAHVEAPKWFWDLEQLLPMKNKTVTVSYLLARKKTPQTTVSLKGRLTGDSLKENGKTRQLICRNEQREFLTWMHKSIKPQELARGELINLPENLTIKSNELRLNEEIKI